MKIEGKGLLVSAQNYQNKDNQQKQIFKVLIQQEDYSDAELVTCIQDYDAVKFEQIKRVINDFVLVSGDYSHGFAKYNDISIIKK